MDLKELEAEFKKDGEIVLDNLRRWADELGDKTFFYYGEEDRRISYREFDRLTNCAANNLISMGVEKGDRISLFLMNPLVTTLAMFGMWKAGAVYCPINFNYKGRLLSYQINDTAPKLLIAEQGLIPMLNNIKGDIDLNRVILHRPLDGAHDYISENDEFELDAAFSVSLFDDLFKGPDSDPGVDLEFKDTANIIYTSGTTGPAKGVVQSHRWMHQYIFNVMKILNQDDVVYNDLPMYHVGGAVFNIVKAAWLGCTVAVWDKFSPNDFWRRINLSGSTHTVLLDVMVPWLMLAEEKQEDKLNTLNKVHFQPLPQYHNQVAKRFGIDIVTSGYGQTEAGNGFVGVIDELADGERSPEELRKGSSRDKVIEIATQFGLPVLSGAGEVKKGFMGKPTPLLEAAILDENDMVQEPGTHGQIAFRSKLPYTILNEYFNKPEATAEVFRNLWFHSGDGGYRDEDGIFYFVDRMGGFIRTRGENVSSYQVEDILTSHPKVGVCAALPIPAEEGEEDDIVVYIVLKPGEQMAEDELRPWIKEEMPRFMQPRHIRFVDALPQTPTYKVEKYKLKDRILTELGRQ